MARAQTDGFKQWLETKAELDTIEADLSGWDKAKCVEQTVGTWGKKEKNDAFEHLWTSGSASSPKAR